MKIKKEILKMNKETPSLSDKEWTNGSYTGYLKDDVKQFIKEILDLLDDDIDEREKYLAEQIKQKAGRDLLK